MDDRTRAAHEELLDHGERIENERREKAIDLMVQDITRWWFRATEPDPDLLRRLVEPIVDHHVACTKRIGREGS